MVTPTNQGARRRRNIDQRARIRRNIEREIDDARRKSRVAHATIERNGDGLIVNGQTYESGWVELAAGDVREAAKFQVRLEEDEVVLVLTSESTGRVERRSNLRGPKSCLRDMAYLSAA